MCFATIFCCFSIITMTQIMSSETKTIPDIAALIDDLNEDLSTDSEEVEYKLKNYHKYLEHRERNLLKEEFQKEISKEERGQERFYDDLLKSVKLLGKNQE